MGGYGGKWKAKREGGRGGTGVQAKDKIRQTLGEVEGGAMGRLTIIITSIFANRLHHACR